MAFGNVSLVLQWDRRFEFKKRIEGSLGDVSQKWCRDCSNTYNMMLKLTLERLRRAEGRNGLADRLPIARGFIFSVVIHGCRQYGIAG